MGTLAVLQVALPLNLAVTGAALLRSRLRRTAADPATTPEVTPATSRRTVLVSGGKMTKALQLARSFHAAGHRVVLVEQGKYRLTGHRFSRAVDRFHVVPAPDAPDYADALLGIVLAEGVDVYVPVCSPAASYYDALAARVLAPHCEVVHADVDLVATLDDKHAFTELAASLGLSVPDARRITDPAQVADFDFEGGDPPYILKSIAYDPVNRLDLTPLPRSTRDGTQEFARSKPISAATPWIMQSLVRGQEYCTHSTVRDGRVTVYCCCESSAFQINYEHVDKPEIEKWVRGFVEPLGVTGQVSFDFIEADDGQVYAIECNPRTHSAVTMFYDHPGVAAAYLDDDAAEVRPTASSRPTYWIYHEVWRLLTQPERLARALVIARGKDAVFDPDDPLPFLMLHHVHIPWLLLRSLVAGKDFLRVDFNIGKLVEPGGD